MLLRRLIISHQAASSWGWVCLIVGRGQVLLVVVLKGAASVRTRSAWTGCHGRLTRSGHLNRRLLAGIGIVVMMVIWVEGLVLMMVMSGHR